MMCFLVVLGGNGGWVEWLIIRNGYQFSGNGRQSNHGFTVIGR